MPLVKIKRLSPDAKLPFRGSEGAAAWDITALDVQLEVVTTAGAARQPRAWWVSTGLKAEIEPGYCMKIYARSGLGTANFLRPSNCVGIIDSDYRGEVKIRLIADEGGLLVEPKAGMVIAQATIEKVEDVVWQEVDELSETTRGGGGFGSTTSGSTATTETVAEAATAASDSAAAAPAESSEVAPSSDSASVEAATDDKATSTAATTSTTSKKTAAK